MEIIQTDYGTQFTSKDFQEGLSIRGLQLALAAPDYQEMNGQVEVIWRTLKTITHSIMVHARVSDEHINVELIYMAYNIFTVLQIKHLVNKDGEPTTPKKLATGTNTSVSNLNVLSCPCVVRKATVHADTKGKKYHQSQKGFCGIFFGIPQHQKRYLIYVPTLIIWIYMGGF